MAPIRVLLVGTAMSTLALCGTVSAQSPSGQQFNDTQQNSAQSGQQGQQISPGEVRSYFRQVENQVNQAVQSGNPQRMQQWTQTNIADGANFQAVVTIGGQGSLGGSREIRILSFSKNDMVRRQQAALSFAPNFLSRIGNYDLGIRVQSIQPVGDAAAVVKTRISESGTIGVNPTGRQFGANQGMETQGMGPAQGQSQAQGQDQSQDQAQNNDQNGNSPRFRQRMAQLQGQMGQTQARGISFNADAECTQLVQRDQNSGRLTIGLSNCNAEMQF